MGKTSVIPNKRPITLSVNRDLVKKAQEKGLNISLILDAALEKEVDPSSSKAYFEAVQKKLFNIENWMRKNRLEDDYYNDTYKEVKKDVVLEKEQGQRDFGQAIADIENSQR